MIRTSAVASIFLAAGQAAAQTIEFLPPGYIATDIAADGRTLAGNIIADGSYETFRWTPDGGVQRLGRASVPAIGRGGGSPDISLDGTRVSATIVSSDNRLTQGIWDSEEGWTETMPPMPPDGRILDEEYGSAHGLSGDGSTLTGFYWNTLGNAQPCTWSRATGMVALPVAEGRSARVNAANFDGSVVVGWEERFDGPWQPRAWRNGEKFILVEQEAGSEAHGLNSEGSIVCGETYDPAFAIGSATLWRWNGAAYDLERLGFLPGTVPNSGGAWFDSVSDDGTIAVGTNMYTFNPGGRKDGIVWTPQDGLVKDVDFIASLGLQFPANMEVRDFNGITPDGSVIIGVGVLDTFEYQTFIITLGNPCPADMDGNGTLNVFDFLAYQTAFSNEDPAADLAAPFGVFNVFDFLAYQTEFSNGC